MSELTMQKAYKLRMRIEHGDWLTLAYYGSVEQVVADWPVVLWSVFDTDEETQRGVFYTDDNTELRFEIVQISFGARR